LQKAIKATKKTHMSKEVLPDSESDLRKKEQVAGMFNSISSHYDFLNRFLSAGTDIRWRRKAIAQLVSSNPQHILDVATGTADMAIEAAKVSKPEKIIGLDISEGMLEVGRKKIADKNLQNLIELQLGDSENMPFKDNSFDAVCVAFGVRNFENLEKGLAEIFRVLKPGGKLVILEFSQPESFPIKQLYRFYSFNILPFFGSLISKDKRAYKYLPESVAEFPSGEGFKAIMQQIGYKELTWQKLTFGICSIYTGVK
jgi:demethylmenaquinone methyltransferase / 2-methoxy-6-polyprenyl-1,4-benzoquinol methylase